MITQDERYNIERHGSQHFRILLAILEQLEKLNDKAPVTTKTPARYEGPNLSVEVADGY